MGLKNVCLHNLSWFCWSKPSRLNENLLKMQKSKLFDLSLVLFVQPPDSSGNRGVKASASEERAHGRKKNRDKKGGGYCECCMIKYENITTVSYHICKS